MKMLKMISIFVGLSTLGAVVYAALRPLLMTISVDILGNTTYVYHLSEHMIVLVFIFLFGLVFPISSKIITMHDQEDRNIDVEIDTSAYLVRERAKVESYYQDVIKPNITDSPEAYMHIKKPYSRPVYSFTGGWLAGKTTAAGMLVKVIREDIEVEVGSETYHDTFNFGNVDESISSFFQMLSSKTNIELFKRLSEVSTPGADMTFDVGPLKLKKMISSSHSANKMRQNIHRKLNKTGKVHIVIIDDIDRLLPLEQAQWLRVLELLGQF